MNKTVGKKKNPRKDKPLKGNSISNQSEHISYMKNAIYQVRVSGDHPSFATWEGNMIRALNHCVTMAAHQMHEDQPEKLRKMILTAVNGLNALQRFSPLTRSCLDVGDWASELEFCEVSPYVDHPLLKGKGFGSKAGA